MPSVPYYGETDLDEFDDDDILEAALGIMRSQAGKPADKRDKRLTELTDRIADFLGARIDENGLPPPSTAATVRSMEHLRALMAKH